MLKRIPTVSIVCLAAVAPLMAEKQIVKLLNESFGKTEEERMTADLGGTIEPLQDGRKGISLVAKRSLLFQTPGRSGYSADETTARHLCPPWGTERPRPSRNRE